MIPRVACPELAEPAEGEDRSQAEESSILCLLWGLISYSYCGRGRWPRLFRGHPAPATENSEKIFQKKVELRIDTYRGYVYPAYIVEVGTGKRSGFSFKFFWYRQEKKFTIEVT